MNSEQLGYEILRAPNNSATHGSSLENPGRVVGLPGASRVDFQNRVMSNASLYLAGLFGNRRKSARTGEIEARAPTAERSENRRGGSTRKNRREQRGKSIRMSIASMF